MLDGRAVRALLSLGMVVSLGATGTYAYWTDTATVEGTTIKAGTIKLRVTDKVTTATSFTTMNVSTMVPGDSTAGVMRVENTGTAPLRYHVDALASNDDGKNLGGQLGVKVTGDEFTGGSGTKKTCAGSALPNSKATFTNGLLGTSALPRQLNAGQVEWVCVEATLPTNALPGLQGAVTNVTFTFTGSSF